MALEVAVLTCFVGGFADGPMLVENPRGAYVERPAVAVPRERLDSEPELQALARQLDADAFMREAEGTRSAGRRRWVVGLAPTAQGASGGPMQAVVAAALATAAELAATDDFRSLPEDYVVLRPIQRFDPAEPPRSVPATCQATLSLEGADTLAAQLEALRSGYRSGEVSAQFWETCREAIWSGDSTPGP